MDSGYLALILRFLKRKKKDTITRISGLQILEVLLNHPAGAKGALIASVSTSDFISHTLWVVPTVEEQQRIETYLSQQDFNLSHHHFYLAPVYAGSKDSPIEDPTLLKCIRSTSPDWVILCIAGGKQEKLGLFLRDALRNKRQGTSAKEQKDSDRFQTHHSTSRLPAILCTGAAIAFFTGGQARIPQWVDRLYLGWLARILKSPKKYFYRYFQALRLPFILGSWEKRSSIEKGQHRYFVSR